MAALIDSGPIGSSSQTPLFIQPRPCQFVLMFYWSYLSYSEIYHFTTRYPFYAVFTTTWYTNALHIISQHDLLFMQYIIQHGIPLRCIWFQNTISSLCKIFYNTIYLCAAYHFTTRYFSECNTIFIFVSYNFKIYILIYFINKIKGNYILYFNNRLFIIKV